MSTGQTSYPEPLEREHGGGVADVAVGDRGLDGQDLHPGSPQRDLYEQTRAGYILSVRAALQRPATLTDSFLSGPGRPRASAAADLEAHRGLPPGLLVELPPVDAGGRRRGGVRDRPGGPGGGPGRRWRARLAVFARAHSLFLDNAQTTTDLIQAESGKNRRMAIEDHLRPGDGDEPLPQAGAAPAEAGRRGGPVPLCRPRPRSASPRAWSGSSLRGTSLRHRDLGLDLGAGWPNAPSCSSPTTRPRCHRSRRADAGGGGPPKALPGRVRRGPGRRPTLIDNANYVMLTEPTRDRPGDRRAGRAQPDRLLPRARRQEPDGRARGRRPGRGRAGRSSARSATPANLHAHQTSGYLPESRYASSCDRFVAATRR